MQNKKWIAYLFLLTLIIFVKIGIFNYLVDPYGVYNSNFFNLIKSQQIGKSRLIKAVNIEKIKPLSIILGSSRAEGAFDPRHDFFLQPSYNLGVAGSSIYESKIYFKKAFEQKKLKKVLLVADYIMFNSKQKGVDEFDNYFSDSYYIYKLLFNIETLKDSLRTIFNKQDAPFYIDGFINPNFIYKNQKNIGHKELFNIIEENFYKNLPKDYLYKDSKNNSFEDLKEIIDICYRNEIELVIIFGPSHIKQWEIFDKRIGIENWYKWKKDIVLTTNKIAKKYKKKQFKIIDFSVYHHLTSEKIPDKLEKKMEYHRESSHYTYKLGSIVLDIINNNIKINSQNDFGVELSLDNIDNHIKSQKINRSRYIEPM